MQVANNQQPLNDDGTPRRKYELDEPENGRYILRATIGLVFANAFILVKNMLFGNDPAPKPQIMSMPAVSDSGHIVGDEREAANAEGG